MLFVKSEIQHEPLSLFNLYLRNTVQELKGSLLQQWRWLRHLKYHLLFLERTLENHKRLRHYGIKDQSVIHLRISSFESSQPPPNRQGAYNVTDSEIDDTTVETGNDADSADGMHSSSVTRGDVPHHCHPDTPPNHNIPTQALHPTKPGGMLFSYIGSIA